MSAAKFIRIQWYMELTVKDSFKNDLDGIGMSWDMTLKYQDSKGSGEVTLSLKVSSPTVSTRQYYAVYVPHFDDPTELCRQVILNFKKWGSQFFKSISIDNYQHTVQLGADVPIATFLTLYVEDGIDALDQALLDKEAKKSGTALLLRDKKFTDGQFKYLIFSSVFVSHDWRDKALIAQPLAHGLIKELINVWYDEYSLNVGDSLRQSIEKGIRSSNKCILIITPNFLSNTGWTKTEFDSIFTKELSERNNVVLPIWYKVSVNEVYEYSTFLAGKLALHWPDPEAMDTATYQRSVELLIGTVKKQIVKTE
jgi:hypothetical protein